MELFVLGNLPVAVSIRSRAGPKIDELIDSLSLARLARTAA